MDKLTIYFGPHRLARKNRKIVDNSEIVENSRKTTLFAKGFPH